MDVGGPVQEEAQATALEAKRQAEATAAAARAAAAKTPAHYSSVDYMLDLANLEVATVCGDGNCGYYASMASGSEDALQHCRRGKRTTAPTAADYEGQQKLRDRCVDWLLHPEQQDMLATELYTREEVAKQRDGKKSAGEPMGVYPNSAALRAMAAVDGVHLVVVTDNKHSRPPT